MKTIAVIGGGWYGSHIALELARAGFNVTLYEKNSRLFSGISGLFGIRLHIGPHYPRSPATRKSCLHGFVQFSTKYPDLIVAHNSSVYAVGNKDSSGEPSKISADDFIKVCQEHSKCKVFKGDAIAEKDFANLEVVVELAEPSIYVGRGLHDYFQRKLTEAGVKLVFNSPICSIIKIKNEQIEVNDTGDNKAQFNHVINTTSFQSLLPTIGLRLPFQVFYQPCLALVYEDDVPTSNMPFSFIVMDGWFPCLMPSVEYGKDASADRRRYILTHGMYTILGSYLRASDAYKHLDEINDAFIETTVKPNCEREITKYFPKFLERFKFVGWNGAVLAKTKSEGEFRASITFQDISTQIVHVLPGKVSNIFDAAEEALAIIKQNHVIYDEDNGIAYISKGTLDAALPDFAAPIKTRNTCDLRPYTGKTLSQNAADSNHVSPKTCDSGNPHAQASFSSKSSNQLLLFPLIVFCICANELQESPSTLARILLGLITSAFFLKAAQASSASSCLRFCNNASSLMQKSKSQSFQAFELKRR